MNAPVLFISHGAPTFAVEPGRLGPRLQQVGRRLPALRAALVVSPHWQTREVSVMASERPATLHDFAGFPERLYELQYAAAGQPELARAAAQRIAAAGFATRLDARRGLDHGAWVPLLHLLPEAAVPVFQVSMPAALNSRQAVELGRALAPLRRQGVLIVASGSMTHNLYEVRQADSAAQPYASEFAAWVEAAVMADAIDRLIDYRREAPHAERAHPSEEHFLPLLVALGAKGDERAELIDGGITHGVLAMDSYVWGLPRQASDE